MILLDTNVLVAVAIADHLHYHESAALLDRMDRPAIAAHSLLEFVSTVTRTSRYGWDGVVVAQQLMHFRDTMDVLQMTESQTTAAAIAFAKRGFRGSLIYDFLIGQHAVTAGLPTIATWNVKHFAPLFPALCIATPAELLETL